VPASTIARAVEGGIEIRLKVVPGARRSEIVGPLGDRLKVRVAAPPEGGKANRAVEALLREALGAEAEIVGGHTTAEKVASLSGPAERLLKKLDEVLGPA
jgi:uncharacterized protein (TIGR00251 family)